MIFININWGGDREEARINTEEGNRWWQVFSEQEVVWGMGQEPYCLRTDVMRMGEKDRIVFQNEFSFEWWGSYDELENQSMVIEVWRWNRFRANTIDSSHARRLVDYATGPVFQDIELSKVNTAQNGSSVVVDDKDRPCRYKATFQLYFQELYDFELNVVDVQAIGLMSESQLRSADMRIIHRANKSASGHSAIEDEDTVRLIYEASGTSDDSEDDKAAGKAKTDSKKRKPAFRRGAISQTGPVLSSEKKQASKHKRRVVVHIKNPSLVYSLRRGVMDIRSGLKRTDLGTNIDRWGNVGKIYYRGTVADLDNDLLYLDFYETSALANNMIGHATVSLRGVQEYGNISGACLPPDWFIENAKKSGKFSPEEIRQVMKSSVGRFEAKIAVENAPKYKQSGELCDMINEKAYLLVKVLRVDRVAIPDQRPISQCDSAVQVQFSGTSYETEVRQDTISPQFNQEFYFELKTSTPSDFTPAELAKMHGPIIFDVWLRSDDEGALTAEHCGHVEINLLELYQEGKPEVKTHSSIRTGQETEYKTAVLKARRRLTCLWTTFDGARQASNVPSSALAPSYLYVDIWLKPFDFTAFSLQNRETSAAGGSSSTTRTLHKSFSSVASTVDGQGRFDPVLPARVRQEWMSRARVWEDKVDEMQARFKGLMNRGFSVTAQSQNRDEHFVSTFLDIIRPPEIIANPRAVAFWIHCLAHTSMEELKAAVPFWSTIDFMLSLGKGDTFAHAILHCSMLRGIPGNGDLRPFVCVGTGWDSEPVAWVMTMNGDGSIIFWDTCGHQQFKLPGRCLDKDRCRRVVVGKRPASQCLSKHLIELEIKRRVRIGIQEMKYQKLKKFDQELLTCDAQILRSPELLKLNDQDTHPHTLVYVTNIDPNSQCYRCGLPPARGILHGYVCNHRLAARLSEPSQCLSDSVSFLCIACSERTYKNEKLPASDTCSAVDDLPENKFSVQPVLPFKTIDIIFDSTNCWLNLQHYCPTSIFYDMWNPLYWHPFTSVVTSFMPFSVASKGLRKAKSQDYYDNIRNKISAKLKKSIENVRRNGNLSTYIQRDPLLMHHIDTGLELSFKQELIDETGPDFASIETAISDWKVELYSKVPANHRYIGHSFLFAFTDSIEITKIILDKLDFLALKEIGTQFIVSSYIGKLPNSLKAAYVYIGIAHPLNESLATATTEARNRSALQGNSSGPSPLIDESLERTRLFTLRMQVFDNDTEFISKMRAELYNKEQRLAGGRTVSANSTVLILNKGNPSKAPFDAKSTSRNEFLSRGEPGNEENYTPLQEMINNGEVGELEEDEYEDDMVGIEGSGEQQQPSFADLISIKEVTADIESAATNAASYFTGLFTQQSSPVQSVPPQQQVQVPPQQQVQVPAQRQPQIAPQQNQQIQLTQIMQAPQVSTVSAIRSRRHQGGPVVTPLSQISAMNPTKAELEEIYRPRLVQRVTYTEQFLQHIPTGYQIPVPSVPPSNSSTTVVHVKKGESRQVVERIRPPKDEIYKFNMDASNSKN
jgi:hypothetical protein